MRDFAFYHFFATAFGVILATVSRMTPQLGLLGMFLAMPTNADKPPTRS